MKLIESYRHIPGGSCACVAWSNVFRHLGVNISESDVFGLGSGLSFGYFAIARQREFNITLIAPNIVNNLFINTGIYGRPEFSSTSEVDNQLIKQSLDDGKPVALPINPIHINGIANANSVEMLDHLPAHWIVVVGYCNEKKIYRFYDNRQFSAIEISFEEFNVARNSGVNKQNPKRLLYSHLGHKNNLSFEKSAILALGKVISNYQDNIKYLAVYNGRYGIEKFSRQFMYIVNSLSDSELKETLGKFIVSMTGAGGMKGGYRPMFYRFLKKLNGLVGSKELEKSCCLFKQASEGWIECGNVLSSLIGERVGKDGLNAVSSLLEEIKSIEVEGIQALDSFLYKENHFVKAIDINDLIGMEKFK